MLNRKWYYMVWVMTKTFMIGVHAQVVTNFANYSILNVIMTTMGQLAIEINESVKPFQNRG
jgi:hypothetical protein